MSKRLLIITLLTWGIVGGANLLASQIETEVMSSLDKDFIAKFEEISIDPVTQEEVFSSGQLMFKAGGLMRFEYKEPDDQLIIIGKQKVWIYDRLLNNVTIADLAETDITKLLIFFRNTKNLSKEFNSIKTSTYFILKPMEHQKLLYFKSLNDKHPLDEIHLAYDVNSKRIEKIGVLGADSSVRIFKFSSFEYPLNIDERDFVFILPPYVEIIER
ncbi:MAG: outer membrane lipoprotein carrier protein LolA [SAR324 cluster bacterium]|nr:outer membrane lipoprotein carrier protein LolA [SAR324 cluster bacterium]